MLLALVWVRLAAIDVALTEAAIGSGVTGALLIGAAGRCAGPKRRPPPSWPAHCDASLRRFSALPSRRRSRSASDRCPNPAPTLAAEAVRKSRQRPSLGNPVNAVLIAYRAYDTLLEKFVLLLALIGVWSLAGRSATGAASPVPRRGRARRGRCWPSSGNCCRRSARRRHPPPVGRSANEPGAPSRAARSSRPCGFSRSRRASSRRLRSTPVAADRAGRRAGGVPRRRTFGLRPRRRVPRLSCGFRKPLILIIEAPLVTLSIAAMLAMLALGPPRPGPSP